MIGEKIILSTARRENQPVSAATVRRHKGTRKFSTEKTASEADLLWLVAQSQRNLLYRFAASDPVRDGRCGVCGFDGHAADCTWVQARRFLGLSDG